MELETIRRLDDCLILVDRLISELEQDNDEIQSCISGEILVQYIKGNELAMELLYSIRRQIVELQQEQEAALLLE